jgi:hypothetical protein
MIKHGLGRASFGGILSFLRLCGNAYPLCIDTNPLPRGLPAIFVFVIPRDLKKLPVVHHRRGLRLVDGDLNGDGQVDCADLAIVKASFGKRTGQAGFNAWADINDDGVVNVIDLALISQKMVLGTVCH